MRILKATGLYFIWCGTFLTVITLGNIPYKSTNGIEYISGIVMLGCIMITWKTKN